MKKIYNCDMNIVNNHVDKNGVLKAEKLNLFFAVLVDRFQRLFGVHTRIADQDYGPDGKGKTWMVLGFAYSAGHTVPIMLSYNEDGYVVFVKTFDPNEKLLADLAQSLMWDFESAYQNMGVEITIQEAWLELRFFFMIPTDAHGFEYNGLHFQPTHRKLEGSLHEITRHLRSISDSRFRKYDGGTWDYDAFYDKARNAGCGLADTFNCLELNQEFCPAENELFQYVENLSINH